MSAPAAVDPQTAYDRHMAVVYDRVLMPKVAAAGYGPRNAREAEAIRGMAARLYGLHQEKVAAHEAQAGTLLDYASQYLDAVDGGRGALAQKQAGDHFAADAAALANAADLAEYLDSLAV